LDFFRMFRNPSKFAQEFLFFTDGLGHLKSKDFFIDREGFNNNLVMYVLSGKLHVEQNGHFILTENQGIIMRLMDKHKYYTDPEDTCEILWMHFSGRQAEFFLKLLDQTLIMPAIFTESRVAELIRHCFTLNNTQNIEREFLVSQTIYSVIISILQVVCKENTLLQLNPQTEFMNQAINYIDSNIYNKITLGIFAKQFNISPYHFCKVFEKYFHTTPMRYVLMKKIEISKYMLTYTHESIASIASSLSFVDQSHFTKTFKSFQNQCPLAFRKKGS